MKSVALTRDELQTLINALGALLRPPMPHGGGVTAQALEHHYERLVRLRQLMQQCEEWRE